MQEELKKDKVSLDNPKDFEEEEEYKVKMGVYKDGELVDFGDYKSKEEAEADFEKYDKPKGRTHIIEDI